MAIDEGDVDIGQTKDFLNTFQVKVRGVWTDTDPTVVQFEIENKMIPKTTYQYGRDNIVEKLATGRYRVSWTFTVDGLHEAAWIGNGACLDRQEVTVFVKGSDLYP